MKAKTMETLFVLLLTTWSPEVPHPMVNVAAVGLTGVECTAAMVEHTNHDPQWNAGIPSCEIDSGDWEVSLSYEYAIEHNGETLVLLPCETEDSANCVWDAEWRGNGLGKSFYDIDGQVFYVESFEP